ncbi:hypothetical protein AJE_00050 [Alishewanella jeotgali KCTC 22429]|uniref:Uncharacterized protein n=2 Tax=Alishewanella jeotgali TaxID=545533 RepID=H3Z9K9_9ALTE|nr:hypothetical protein AJE_00050 [Alishewanella jeotgali KCTC 22429]
MREQEQKAMEEADKRLFPDRLPEHPAAALAVLTQQQAVDMNTSNTTLSHEQQKAVIQTKEVVAQMEEVMREIGQIEAFDFMQKLATVASLKLIQKIKETKSYKGLVYKNESGELATVATFDEFCDLKLGAPRRTVDERLLCLNTFGEEFFEASQKIGLGYRELRKLRQLPADQQQLVIENEAVELGDKDALRELIDDLNAKHQQELKAAKGEKAELEQALKVARQMRDEAQAEANKHKEVLAQRKFNPESWKRDVSQIVTDIATLEGTVLQALTKLVALRTKIAESDSDEVFAKDPATYHAAMEFMCGAMHHASRCLAEDVALFWQDTDVMLGAYTDKARPALEVLEQLAQNASQGSEE